MKKNYWAFLALIVSSVLCVNAGQIDEQQALDIARQFSVKNSDRNKKGPRKAWALKWLRHKDSNPDKLIQSQSCYRYTMSQRALIIIPIICALSRVLFDFRYKIIYNI